MPYLVAMFYNGLGIYEGRDFKAQKFSLAPKLNRSTKSQIIDFSPALVNTLLAVRSFSLVCKN